MNTNRTYTAQSVMNDKEKAMLEAIAKELSMTISETIRHIVRIEFEGRFGKESIKNVS